MMQTPTPEQLQEMLELRTKAQAWIDDMAIAGIAEEAALNAILLALIERRLTSGGVNRAVAWLHRMAQMIEQMGPAMLSELQQQGR